MEEKTTTKDTKVHSSKKFVGIKGWLLFFVLALSWTLIVNIYGFSQSAVDYFNWGGLVFGLVVLNICLNLFAVIYIFMKSKKATMIVVSFLVLALITNIYFNWAGVYAVKESLLFETITTGIWIGYFVNSKRVKNTLVN